MHRRQFLHLAASAALAAPAAKPNIVIILADDLGYGDLSCYGQKRFSTPNIDRLAAEGLRFTDAYAGAPVDAPSLSVMMTGRHGGHASIRANPGGIALLPEDITFGEILQKAGYRTGCFGKWGLGDLDSAGMPQKKGFERFYGYYHAIHAHFQYPGFAYDDTEATTLTGNHHFGYALFGADLIMDHARGFIDSSVKRQVPFLTYIHFPLPHLELMAPRDLTERFHAQFGEEKPYIDPVSHFASQPHPRAAYAAQIAKLDQYVGTVLETLKRNGIDDNTLVLFLSDNGSAAPLWNDGGFFQSTGGLRGSKETLYEGGLRIPAIARWTGRIRPAVSRQPWTLADVLPTLAALAGATPPAGLDGVSLEPTLFAQGKQKEPAFLYWELPGYNAKTGAFAPGLPPQAIRQGKWKAVRPTATAPLELYDLAKDPAESSNVATANPAVVKKLEALLATARTDPRPQRQPNSQHWSL